MFLPFGAGGKEYNLYIQVMCDRILLILLTFTPFSVNRTVDIEAYIDTEKNMRSLLRWIPKLILTTIEEMALQIPIMVARIVGMITFHWRRLVW